MFTVYLRNMVIVKRWRCVYLVICDELKSRDCFARVPKFTPNCTFLDLVVSPIWQKPWGQTLEGLSCLVAFIVLGFNVLALF